MFSSKRFLNSLIGTVENSSFTGHCMSHPIFSCLEIFLVTPLLLMLQLTNSRWIFRGLRLIMLICVAMMSSEVKLENFYGGRYVVISLLSVKNNRSYTYAAPASVLAATRENLQLVLCCICAHFRKVKGANSSSRDESHHRTTGRHLPYGIAPCYLPPDTSERAFLNPSQ